MLAHVRFAQAFSVLERVLFENSTDRSRVLDLAEHHHRLLYGCSIKSCTNCTEYLYGEGSQEPEQKADPRKETGEGEAGCPEAEKCAGGDSREEPPHLHTFQRLGFGTREAVNFYCVHCLEVRSIPREQIFPNEARGMTTLNDACAYQIHDGSVTRMCAVFGWAHEKHELVKQFPHDFTPAPQRTCVR